MKKLGATSRFLSRCALGGLLLVGIPGWGVAQTDGLVPARPPSPFARFPGVLPAAARQAVPTGATTDTTVQTAEGDLVTFDAPGAISTTPSGINPAGAIAGTYCDAVTCHGFLRARDGTFTTFDVPGDVFGTFAYGINPGGLITGFYCDAINCHGFVRARDGGFSTFDVPGDVFGTYGVGINPGGVVAGQYCDTINCHSFLRARDGTFTTFDPYFVINLSGIINPAGGVTGYYFDTSPVVRSFVRDPKGTVTIFDAPSVCTTANGTFASGINPEGAVVGTYYDPGCAHFHAFLRAPDGGFTTIDFPGATDTEANSINPGGTIIGAYFPPGGSIPGFVRSPDGAFTAVFGVDPTAINPAGTVTGYWFDVNAVAHGFLFQPR